MRVDPKSGTKAKPTSDAPAPKPKTEFAAVLRQGREPAAPEQPPAPQQPAGRGPKIPLPASPAPQNPKQAGPEQAPPKSQEKETVEPLAAEPAPAPLAYAPPVEAVAETAPAAAVVPIERIADEVLLIARPDGSHEIQAEIDSKVMPDLRISVVQKGDRIEVRLLTDTPATQRALEQALPQLTQALEARQLNPALLQVMPRAMAPTAMPAPPPSPDARKRQQQGRDSRRDRGRR